MDPTKLAEMRAAMMNDLGPGRLKELALNDMPRSKQIDRQAEEVLRLRSTKSFSAENALRASAWNAAAKAGLNDSHDGERGLGGIERGQSHRAKMTLELARLAQDNEPVKVDRGQRPPGSSRGRGTWEKSGPSRPQNNASSATSIDPRNISKNDVPDRVRPVQGQGNPAPQVAGRARQSGSSTRPLTTGGFKIGERPRPQHQRIALASQEEFFANLWQQTPANSTSAGHLNPAEGPDNSVKGVISSTIAGSQQPPKVEPESSNFDPHSLAAGISGKQPSLQEVSAGLKTTSRPAAVRQVLETAPSRSQAALPVRESIRSSTNPTSEGNDSSSLLIDISEDVSEQAPSNGYATDLRGLWIEEDVVRLFATVEFELGRPLFDEIVSKLSAESFSNFKDVGQGQAMTRTELFDELNRNILRGNLTSAIHAAVKPVIQESISTTLHCINLDVVEMQEFLDEVTEILVKFAIEQRRATCQRENSTGDHKSELNHISNLDSTLGPFEVSQDGGQHNVDAIETLETLRGRAVNHTKKLIPTTMSHPNGIGKNMTAKVFSCIENSLVAELPGLSKHDTLTDRDASWKDEKVEGYEMKDPRGTTDADSGIDCQLVSFEDTSISEASTTKSPEATKLKGLEGSIWATPDIDYNSTLRADFTTTEALGVKPTETTNSAASWKTPPRTSQN